MGGMVKIYCVVGNSIVTTHVPEQELGNLRRPLEREFPKEDECYYVQMFYGEFASGMFMFRTVNEFRDMLRVRSPEDPVVVFLIGSDQPYRRFA